MRSRSRARIRTRITATGWVFIISLVLLLLAAWNTGANLLYIVTGGLGSFILVSLALTGYGLRRLEVSREGPAAVHRAEKFAVTVRLENHKWLLPVMSLRIERARAPGQSAAYVLRVPARRAVVVRMTEVFEKRGVHALPEIVLASAFPFALFERRRNVPDVSQVVVYPRVISVRASILEQLPGACLLPSVTIGDGDEFFSLRDYIPGDDVRHVAWRASARRGTLLVKELARETSRYIVFVIDTLQRHDAEQFEERFEEVIEIVASLSVALLGKQYTVAIVTEAFALVGGEGKTQERRVLETLARVMPHGATPPGFAWFLPGEECGRASYVFASPDPQEWGRRGPRMGSWILDPREAVRA